MHAIAFWPTVVMVTIAAVADVRTRRVPNWLVGPALLAGLLVHGVYEGMPGVGRSLQGVGLAVAVTAILYWLRSLGMGDLKLCSAVGAWIGPAQMVFALWATAVAGGVLAVAYAIRHGVLLQTVARTGTVLAHVVRNGPRPHPTLNLDNPAAVKMPYAVPIAVGTIFSFYTQ